MTNFQKRKRKKGTFWVKEKQAGAELNKKKEIFGPKIGKKLSILTNFLKKSDFSGQQKNKLGLSLCRKKKYFQATNWGKN